jgi:hypothetical protein
MPNNFYEIDFLRSLFLSLCLEGLVLFSLIELPFFAEIGIKRVKIVGFGIFATCATLPYLWFVLPAFIHNRLAYHIIGEISVVLLESVIYYILVDSNYKKLLLISLICNTTSYAIGLLI